MAGCLVKYILLAATISRLALPVDFAPVRGISGPSARYVLKWCSLFHRAVRGSVIVLAGGFPLLPRALRSVSLGAVIGWGGVFFGALVYRGGLGWVGTPLRLAEGGGRW